MRWDTGRGWHSDEPATDDLYPPDITEVTPEASSARKRAGVGTFLVTIGTGLVLERIVGRDLDLFWLGVGLGLIAAWLQAPQFWLFAAGAIITGMATGSFFESLVSFPFETTIGSLFSAAGFFAVFVRYPQRAKWAIIPALVIVVFGALAGAVELIGLVPAVLGSLGVPTLLILGGGLLFLRNALPSPAVRIGTVVIGLMLLTSLVSTVPWWDGSRVADDGPLMSGDGAPRITGAPIDLPALEGRTLVVEADEGSVTLRTTPVGTGSVLADGVLFDGGAVEFEDSSERVTVRWKGRHTERWSVPTELSWTIEVPEGSRVMVTTDEGPIDAAVDEGTFVLESDEGDIRVVVDERDAAVSARSDDGAITVDGEDKGEEFDTGDRTSSATVVTIRTDDGAVTIDGLQPAA